MSHPSEDPFLENFYIEFKCPKTKRYKFVSSMNLGNTVQAVLQPKNALILSYDVVTDPHGDMGAILRRLKEMGVKLKTISIRFADRIPVVKKGERDEFLALHPYWAMFIDWK